MNAVTRARRMLGCRFRPQGRDPAHGLDCVGLVLTAHQVPETAAPRDYRARGHGPQGTGAAMAPYFRRVRPSRRREGDVLVLAVAPDALHLAILTAAGFIHADAGLRRIVETPGTPPWPIQAIYRRRVRRPRREV